MADHAREVHRQAESDAAALLTDAGHDRVVVGSVRPECRKLRFEDRCERRKEREQKRGGGSVFEQHAELQGRRMDAGGERLGIWRVPSPGSDRLVENRARLDAHKLNRIGAFAEGTITRLAWGEKTYHLARHAPNILINGNRVLVVWDEA